MKLRPSIPIHAYASGNNIFHTVRREALPLYHAGTGCEENSSAEALTHQGLIPRVLQYIFSCMATSKEQVHDHDVRRFE